MAKIVKPTLSVLAFQLLMSAGAVVPVFAAVDPRGLAPQPAEVANLLAKSEEALKQGHPEVAVIHLKNAENLAPQSADVHRRLGLALLLTNVPAEAERELSIALQRGAPRAAVLPPLLQAMLAQRKGQLLLNQYPAPSEKEDKNLAIVMLRARASAQVQIGKIQDAVVSLDQALALERNVGNLIARAQLAENSNDRELATRLTAEALTKAPNDVSALLFNINLLQHSNKPEQALEYANRLVKETNQTTARLTRAGVYIQLNQDSRALDDLNEVQKTTPNHPVAVFYRALIRARAHDAKGAWALAQNLPRDFAASRPEMGTAVGEMANAAGHRDVAIDILHRTIELYPKDAGARVRLASVYLQMREVSNAIATLEPVKDSKDPRVSAVLGQAYAQQNKVDEGLQLLQRAADEGFGGEELQKRLASANIARGKLEEGIQSLQRLNTNKPNQPEVVGPLIIALLQKGELDSAAKLADSLTKAQPKNPLGPFFQGLVYARRGETDRAAAAYNQALLRDPKLSPARYNRGLLLTAKGDIAGAQKDFEAALKADPHNIAAAVRLSSLLQRIGQPDPALKVLKDSVQQNPKALPLYSELYRFYLNRGRVQEAKGAIQSYLAKSPNDPSGLALQGQMYLETGQTDAALASLKGLVQRYPHSQDLAILLARAYLKKGDNREAQRTLEAAIADEVRSPATHIALVQTDLSVGDHEKAMRDAQAFSKSLPGPVSDQILASVFMAQKRFDEAERLLKQSLSRSPDPRTALQLNAVYRMEQKTAQADKLLQTWLASHPKDGLVHTAYGQALMERDQSAAETHFRAALSVDPYDVVSLNNLAWLVSKRNPSQAEGLADRALVLAPTLAAVQDTAGWTKWLMHKKAEAINLLQRAYNRSNDAEIGYHYAVALADTGRASDAKRVLSQILNRGSKFQDMENARALYAKVGR